jgi:heme exporter protein D
MLDLDMTPYAAFVWPAWAISAIVLTALVVRAVAASRRWKAELKRLEGDPEARPQAAQGAVGPQE